MTDLANFKVFLDQAQTEVPGFFEKDIWGKVLALGSLLGNKEALEDQKDTPSIPSTQSAPQDRAWSSFPIPMDIQFPENPALQWTPSPVAAGVFHILPPEHSPLPIPPIPSILANLLPLPPPLGHISFLEGTGWSFTCY